jgi:hypothetical protein
MITHFLTYGCKCDHCGKLWRDHNNSAIGFVTKDAMMKALIDEGTWLIHHGKTFCPTCWGTNYMNERLTSKYITVENLVRNPHPINNEGI